MTLRTCLIAMAVAGGVAAAPAAATVTHFDLGFTHPVSQTINSATFQTIKDGVALNVTVTAVQYFNGQFRAATRMPILSYAGQGVIGAVSPNDQDGQQNWHQVDNANGVDFLVFQFDKAVTLDSIGREGVAMGPDRTATWSNVSIGGGNVAGGYSSGDLAGLLGGLTTVQGLKAEGRNPDGSDVTTFDTDTLSFAHAGNLWLIGADFDTSVASGFKLATLGVDWESTPPPAVPEPATWAMLLLGFGLVGSAFRLRPAIRIVNA